jgi:beta-lactamase regulating signal transducer with metallopeptidase domain
MSLTFPTISQLWTAAGWTMLHLMWVGAVIALIASLVRGIFRSACPETRYGVALLCLLAMSVSPALILAWVVKPGPGAQPLAATLSSDLSRMSPLASESDPLPSRLPSDREPTLGRFDGARPRSRLDSLVPILTWFWLCGSACTLGMLMMGLVGVERLRCSTRLVESGEIPRRCRALAESVRITRRVSVGICDRLVMPVLIGILRPVILLPPIALSGWSVEQLEMVLLHELAHLRRWDNLVNLLQRFVESLLFFHPVVWWLSSWVRLERELCCDRLVVERLGQPEAYAEMLVAFSETSGRNHRVVMAMADRHVMTRIRRLLNLEDRSMKVTMPEGLGLLGALVVGASLILGSQGAQTKPAGDPDKLTRSVTKRDADDIKDTAGPAARPSVHPPEPVSPKSPRAISIISRGSQKVVIQRLPTTPDGVVTYRCRGGIKIVCKSQTLGTIRLEADEAVIKRVDRGRDDKQFLDGETWIDEADLPMEIQLTGNAVISQGKFADNGDQRTCRAPVLDYDFVTGRVVAPPVGHELALQLTPVPASSQRVTNLFARSAQQLLITQLAETIEGVRTFQCRGGIMIVSKSPRFGTVSMEADEAVIVRNLYRRRGETRPAPDGVTWVEEDELPMRVHLKGNVILRQNQETTAKIEKPKTFRARELDYNFVTDRVVAFDAELEEATRKIESPRIELLHRMVRQPDGSLAPSEHSEVRLGHVGPQKPTGPSSSASTKTKDAKTSAP